MQAPIQLENPKLSHKICTKKKRKILHSDIHLHFPTHNQIPIPKKEGGMNFLNKTVDAFAAISTLGGSKNKREKGKKNVRGSGRRASRKETVKQKSMGSLLIFLVRCTFKVKRWTNDDEDTELRY